MIVSFENKTYIFQYKVLIIYIFYCKNMNKTRIVLTIENDWLFEMKLFFFNHSFINLLMIL